jgi:eukaryotic-like serine/threonine-protein kinase
MVLTSGTIPGLYDIQSRLRGDGTGDVCRARDIRLDRKIAVEMLPSSFANDAWRLQWFVLCALNNPNLLFILDVGSLGEVDYLVSDFLEEQPLRDPVSSGALP